VAKLSKIEREMRDHSERFDYGDIPPMGTATPTYNRQMDERRPAWLKAMLAERAKG
jgi:hypothetical protein